MTKTIATGKRHKPKAFESPSISVGVRGKRALIQWPSGKQLDEVSMRLRRISQIGISAEANGDYFTSGDLAYQLHEIVRSTSELLKRSVRSERL
jgi:hypothetical protein